MSDKHLQTRKTLSLTSGIFGVSSLALVGWAGFSIVTRVFKYGLIGALGSFSFWALLALILVFVPMFRGAFKSFNNLDYAKSKRKAWMSSLGAVGLALIDFLW